MITSKSTSATQKDVSQSFRKYIETSKPSRTVVRAGSAAPVVQLTSGLWQTYYASQKPQQIAELNINQKDSDRKRSIVSHELPVKKSKFNNNGFDDENDDYIVKEGEVWGNKYAVEKLVGKGSFGQVVRASEISNGQVVAIKIIKNRKSFSEQANIEIEILEFLNIHQDPDSQLIVRSIEHFVHENHKCIVYEICSYNLYEVLRKGGFVGLPISLIRKFTVQLLVTLRFLSKPDVQVIHCDLKPEK